MAPLRFDVMGHPTPQGSKRRMGNGMMVEAGGARLANWRSAVAEAAHRVAPDRPLDGPLTLEVVFRFSMPASRPKAIRIEGWCVKSSAPDLDKLVRSLADGLTAGGLIQDDARICSLRATKLEVVGWTGAQVTINQHQHGGIIWSPD